MLTSFPSDLHGKANTLWEIPISDTFQSCSWHMWWLRVQSIWIWIPLSVYITRWYRLFISKSYWFSGKVTMMASHWRGNRRLLPVSRPTNRQFHFFHFIVPCNIKSNLVFTFSFIKWIRTQARSMEGRQEMIFFIFLLCFSLLSHTLNSVQRRNKFLHFLYDRHGNADDGKWNDIINIREFVTLTCWGWFVVRRAIVRDGRAWLVTLANKFTILKESTIFFVLTDSTT